LERIEGDRELLVEQMKFYLEDSPILIRDVGEAIRNRDRVKLQMSAHRLRGLSAGFDAADLVDYSTELEVMGRNGDIGEAASRLPQLTEAWERTCASIKGFIRQAVSSSEW
jgi:HPt (histidine-containing phosphotransfer) domain-containing protein